MPAEGGGNGGAHRRVRTAGSSGEIGRKGDGVALELGTGRRSNGSGARWLSGASGRARRGDVSDGERGKNVEKGEGVLYIGLGRREVAGSGMDLPAKWGRWKERGAAGFEIRIPLLLELKREGRWLRMYG